jgi:hypothetical protein
MPANYTKTIICLANSRKNTGRCVAGKVVEASGIGDWVRPVSGRQTGELSEEDRRFEDGRDPRLLDVVRIPMVRPSPHDYQTENHLIDEGYYWTRIRTAEPGEVAAALDVVRGPLWDNTSPSTWNGCNDRVDEAAASHLRSSLKLVEVADLQVHVEVEGARFGNHKKKVRGRFSLDGIPYWLAVTDPAVERQYLPGEEGTFDVGRAVLCVSLGEPFGGYAYKLIAAVIAPIAR